jgi:type III pantothenate kinase
VIVSSVVPKATVSLKRALRSLGFPRPLVLGETIQAPVINRYRIPSQVGQDRLVNAAAAYFLYGGPAIVVDFGTAVTIDLVNRGREYLGGLIVPGMEIALEALSSRAALLPKIKLTPPRELLGRDTVSSMKAGLFHGYGLLCDGIVHRLKAKYAPKAKVIATGGHARLIAPFCRTVQVVNRELTLRGLELTYRNGGGCQVKTWHPIGAKKT